MFKCLDFVVANHRFRGFATDPIWNPNRSRSWIPELRAGRRPIRPGFLYPHPHMLTHLPTLTHVYGYTIDFNTPKIVIFWEKKENCGGQSASSSGVKVAGVVPQKGEREGERSQLMRKRGTREDYTTIALAKRDSGTRTKWDNELQRY